MKNLLTITFLILVLISGLRLGAMDRKAAELEKYSYMMVGFSSDSANATIYPLGTCFFIRKDSILYFVTAKHNITGISSFDGSPTPKQYDFIGFRYFNNETNQIAFSRLDIRQIKSQIETGIFFNSPDAIALQLNDPLVERFIYSLESYNSDSLVNFVPDSIFSLGYPYSDPTAYVKEMRPVHYNGIIIHDIDINHPYPKNENIYFTSVPKSIQGQSGAPVFYKYPSPTSGESRYFFAGLLFGANFAYDYAYCVKAKAIPYY